MLIDLAVRAAGEIPDHALVIEPDGGLTWADAVERATAVARGLQAEGIERFGSVLTSAADTVVAVLAASAVGAEACLYPRDLEPEAVERIAERFGHGVVLADPGREAGAVRTVDLDELARAGGDGAGGEAPTGSDPAPVLILTTGTTGEQKGARHEWSRLIAGVRHPERAAGTRWLLAYNLNQFAGIQVLLHVLAGRGTLVVPASRRADDVIAAIEDHAVTHVSATPTFWRLLVGRLDAETAARLAIAQITLGGEAAPESLIARLRELFPDARLSHVYAGTEFGSVVSVRDGQSGIPLSVLDRPDDAEVRFRIVDGELQVLSRVGMLGYHEAGDSEPAWRATGDLVEIREDRIHFVGRTSEIINVGGAKVHPLPVEELICSVPGVAMAAVYGRSNAVTGQIVAADIVPAEGVDPEELERRVREACESLPAAGRPRRIRFVEELQTLGNKVLRRAAGARA